MITKEKNRTKIICTVITAVLAAVTGGSVLRLYNVQNVTQTVNGNVIQILGETGSNISANMDLTDSTEELISEYKKVIDENSQYQTNQTTLQGQVQSLQSENDDLKSQIQILKGTLLNTYSSDEINSVIEQGGLKRDISKRLDNLECLDSVNCEQVPSVKDLYGTTHSISYRFEASDTAWAKFKLDPMMMKVDFRSIKDVGKNPKGLFVTWIVNWLIKPFTMYGMASLFFFVVFKAFIAPELATEYLAGAVLLGAAPCTAMVFVWSALTKGDPAYTVVQVATNDLIILVAFVPIVKFLLGVSNVSVPWDTLILSVVLFVVIPLAGGMLTRYFVTRKKGAEYFESTFVKKFDGITTIGLLLTLVLIFAFQGQVILDNPLHIVLIAVPLILQTFLIFGIAYGACWLLKLPHRIAAPAGMIGASNFFELAVAVAVALFGTTSPAALATTVGVLTEVPVMLFLVKIANKTKGRFPA